MNKNAGMHSSYLVGRRIYPYITGITVDQGRHTVLVPLAAGAPELVPLLGAVTLRGQGKAQGAGPLRGRSH